MSPRGSKVRVISRTAIGGVVCWWVSGCCGWGTSGYTFAGLEMTVLISASVRQLQCASGYEV